MKFYFQQAFRAAILLLFVIFILKLHFTGDLLKFINPKYELLSLFGAAIFLILFFVQLQRVWGHVHHEHENCHDHDDHHHDHGYTAFNFKKVISYSIILLPLFTGFVFPPSTLDASIALKKGGMLAITNNAMSSEEESLPLEVIEDDPTIIENESSLPDNESAMTEEVPPTNDNPEDPNLYSNTISQEEYTKIENEMYTTETIEMTESLYSTYYEMININMHKVEGKKIKLKGFVFREDDFTANQLVIGRFVITHCVADAGILGFLSEFDDATALTEDTWIEATGTIIIKDYNGTPLPVIKVTEWEEVEESDQPYLYPLTVEIM